MSELNELQLGYIKYCNQKYEMKANFLFESGFKNSLELDIVQFLIERLNALQSEIDQLKAEKEVVLELAKQWQETARQLCITDDKHVICSLLCCAEDVEKALRGEHE